MAENLEISIAMLYKPDVYFLQHRNGLRQKGAIGLLGCFGGEKLASESPQQAAVRELGEETNLFRGLSENEQSITASHLRKIDEVEVESDHKGKIVAVTAHIVEVLLPLAANIYTVNPQQEGQAVALSREEIIEKDDKLTPATQAFFRRYLDYGA